MEKCGRYLAEEVKKRERDVNKNVRSERAQHPVYIV